MTTVTEIPVKAREALEFVAQCARAALVVADQGADLVEQAEWVAHQAADAVSQIREELGR